MVEVIARVRFSRRWNNLFPGDVAVFPLDTANSLVAQRYAVGLAPPEGAVLEGAAAAEAAPAAQRGQPGAIVRK